MLTVLKRVLMWLYCREIISDRTVARLFKRFNLTKV